MATESDHRLKAAHNQAFLDAIDHARFPDWAVTAAFYKAVHLVEALFARDNRAPGGSHLKRNQVLKRHYKHVWKQYQPLYNFSRQARYWCTGVLPEHVTYVNRRLGRVEREIFPGSGS